MEMSKKGFGINGQHSRLGEEVTEAEFRGYMIAKIESHHAVLLELKNKIEKNEADVRETVSLINQRTTSLETARTQVKGVIGGIMIFSGIITALIVAFLVKMLGL